MRDFDATEAAKAYAGGFTTEQQARMIRAEQEIRRAFDEYEAREQDRLDQEAAAQVAEGNRRKRMRIASLFLVVLIIAKVAGVA